MYIYIYMNIYITCFCVAVVACEDAACLPSWCIRVYTSIMLVYTLIYYHMYITIYTCMAMYIRVHLNIKVCTKCIIVVVYTAYHYDESSAIHSGMGFKSGFNKQFLACSCTGTPRS